MMFLLIVTLTSMLLAAIMSAIAWRVAGEDRRRSEARVVALSAEIHEAEPRRAQEDPAHARSAEASRSAHTSLFAVRQAPSGVRRVAVLAGVVLVFGAAVAVAITGGVSRAPRTAESAARAVPAASPLELVALGHDHVADQLTVRGVVRNPPSAAGIDRLTAVVLLFTADGAFITSGRAGVASPTLPPGGESTFEVTVPAAGDVGRYRVSFRTDDRSVPHLDRRHEG